MMVSLNSLGTIERGAILPFRAISDDSFGAIFHTWKFSLGSSMHVEMDEESVY